jgi:threonine synthase
VAQGALPFSCQGSDNGLTIEGGKTLGWEIVSSLLQSGQRLDRLFVQVGGGALASSCIQALEEARALGLLPGLPRLHAVQTEGAHPLRRAYDRVLDTSLGLSPSLASGGDALGEDQRRADEIARRFPGRGLDEPLRRAAARRSAFMWPWEKEPRSIASGILDDETYDWLEVVRGSLASGGFPVVVGEEALREAHRLAKAETGVRVDPTGSAGLAGYLRLLRAGVVAEGEAVAVLFTGVERG